MDEGWTKDGGTRPTPAVSMANAFRPLNWSARPYFALRTCLRPWGRASETESCKQLSHEVGRRHLGLQSKSTERRSSLAMRVFGYFGDWEIHEASHVNKALWRTDVATSISVT